MSTIHVPSAEFLTGQPEGTVVVTTGHIAYQNTGGINGTWVPANHDMIDLTSQELWEQDKSVRIIYVP